MRHRKGFRRTLVALPVWALALHAPAAGADASLIGHVVDEQTGRAVVGAEVRVAALEAPTLTNAMGFFVLRDLPAGAHVLVVRHLGYAERTVEVVLEDGQNHEVTVLLGPEPIELEGLAVSVVPRRLFNDMNDLAIRLERGQGDFVLRDEIEARGGNLATLIQGKRGVRIKSSGSAFSGMYAVLRSARRTQATGNGQFRIVDCHPSIFVDGRRWSRRATIGDEPFDLTELMSSDLEAVEVYAGAGSVPGEFGGGEAACGVIVAWTRRGGLRPGIGR